MPEHRLTWTRALEGWDHEALLSALADDVVIRVAVHDEPMHGRAVADFLFGVLREELAPPRITDEIVEGGSAVVLFETEVDGLGAQGLNVLRFGDDGRVGDLTVFFRPLETLARIGEVVGQRMQAQFGPPA
jgi:hypothetical protein